ncbi:hypothetical protein ABT009_30545 [Streptomyces sp. NPDC002896]|uniref:hypothetical protein n=1 Tax=Streptomyces sp. NPDC002896 TaxID=3154438 RepID=UPI003329D008
MGEDAGGERNEATPESPVRRGKPRSADVAAQAFRETAISMNGRRKIVRTEQVTTLARLEREHTKAVRDSLTVLHHQNVDDLEAEQLADVESREWPDKEGFPGSGEQARARVLEGIKQQAERSRKRKFTIPKTHWDDARKGLPKVRFDIDVTDSRVSEFHEYVEEPQAADSESLSASSTSDTSASDLPPAPGDLQSLIGLMDAAEPATAPSDDLYDTADLFADPGIALSARTAAPQPEEAPAATEHTEPDLTENLEGQMVFHMVRSTAEPDDPGAFPASPEPDSARPQPAAPAAAPKTAAPDLKEETPMAAPITEPVPAPAAAAPETGSDRLQAAAENDLERSAQQEGKPAVTKSPATPSNDSLDERLLARAALAPAREDQELPLWTGNDLPTGAWREEDSVLYDGYGTPQWRLKTASTATSATKHQAQDPPSTPTTDAYDPVDIREAFKAVEEAWADIVPHEQGTVEDLLTAVDGPLRELEQRWQRTVPLPQAAEEQEAAAAQPDRAEPPVGRRDPAPVNAALRQADTHAAALSNLPEWQELQTLRGATTHLWNVIRERAGDYFEQLRSDVRVQGFWRTVSVRTTEKIAEWARAGADGLRRGRGGDLPTAEALLNLSDAALTYSTPGIERPDEPDPASARNENLAAVRQLRTSSRTGGPVAYGSREEATQASRDVAEAFQTWRESPMGQELTTSSTHPCVVAFRQAWQRLPAADLPDGPGSAAGPYGDVGRNAQALVERAEAANAERAKSGQQPRFAAPDVDSLRAVVALAEHHGGRLAVTLPPGLTGPAAPGAAAPQAAPPRPTVAAPVVAAATSGSPSMSA